MPKLTPSNAKMTLIFSGTKFWTDAIEWQRLVFRSLHIQTLALSSGLVEWKKVFSYLEGGAFLS